MLKTRNPSRATLDHVYRTVDYPRQLPKFKGSLWKTNPIRFLAVTVFLRLCPHTPTAWNHCVNWIHFKTKSTEILSSISTPQTLEAYLVSLKLNDDFQNLIHNPSMAFDPVNYQGTWKWNK